MAKMEVSYSRRLDYQYLMIDAGEDVVVDYRLSMLVNNQINGFLPVHVQQMNGKRTLSYEITSLQSLPEFLDTRKITYEEMVSLLLQFCSAVLEVGRYLLDGEGILLEPEYIYLAKSFERVRFCYYPYQHTPVYQSVNLLCRFLIDHIDYDDRRSLELAYGLFQESLKENLSIRAIVGCIKDKLEVDVEKSTDEKRNENSPKIPLESQEEQANGIRKKEESPVRQMETQQTRSQEELRKLSDSREIKKETKKETTRKSRKRQSALSAICILLIVVILCYVLFTAGRRLLQLEMVSENLLIVFGSIIGIAAIAAGGIAYWILKPKH